MFSVIFHRFHPHAEALTYIRGVYGDALLLCFTVSIFQGFLIFLPSLSECFGGRIQRTSKTRPASLRRPILHILLPFKISLPFYFMVVLRACMYVR